VSPRLPLKTRNRAAFRLAEWAAVLLRLPLWQQIVLGCGVLLLIVGTGFFVYAYSYFSDLIDQRLSGQIFNNASLVFAAPAGCAVGDDATPEEIAGRLRKAFYTEGGTSSVGTYKIDGNRLEIEPGPSSYLELGIGNSTHADTAASPPGQQEQGSTKEGPAAIEFRDGRITSITDLDSHKSLDSYLLEPEVITTLFDQSRAKRLLVDYDELPQVLVNAVLAAEDHRFFSHHGVNLYRILGAAIADIRSDGRSQGGSTLTMQLARDFFLTRHRTFRRKLEEIFLALIMEQRLSKQQIFELYANQTYLGQRGSFSIYGFGEAADAYFNKDVRSLTLPEAALLAALIRGPNLYSPYRNATRAKERRNLVLRRMRETGFITTQQEDEAAAAPFHLAQQNLEGSQAPFFVDMVRDQLLAQIPERDLVSQSFRIYTSLDLNLQRAASEAVPAGMQAVDHTIARLRRRKKEPLPDPNQPQVALLALDPHTGEVKALVGGRNYGVSQLNHVLARRQPGSSFKPFVYAAALSSGIDGSQPLVTPATILDDTPATFVFNGQTYDPGNFKQEYHGQVSVRQALAHSLNVATVHLAEMVSYDKVKQLAMDAGFNHNMLATPALALGAYVATPLEVAGAYTIFANQGDYVAPGLVTAVRDGSGRIVWQSPHTSRQVLDPRVSYLMVSLMQSVINNGTAADVRSRGFAAPAAGKTGTSHDGWFAGFTSNLLCITWVGYDDDRDIRLSGAQSALPVWTEFMKRAVALPAYRDVHDFTPPSGVITAETQEPVYISPERAAAYGVSVAPGAINSMAAVSEVFIEGTEPRQPAILQGVTSGISGLIHKVFGSSPSPAAASPPASAPPRADNPSAQGSNENQAGNPSANSAQGQPQKKKGVFKKFLGIFKGGSKQDH
jgi:penicillin-binding protein 1B